MIYNDAPCNEAKNKCYSGSEENTLLNEVQTSLRAALANNSPKTNPVSAEDIGIVGTSKGLVAVDLDPAIQSAAKNGTKELYPGILDPKVGIPNPVEALPDLSIEDLNVAPSIERYEHLHGMTKDAHLTVGAIEAAVIDKGLSVSDREKFKALLPNFEYYKKFQLNPLAEPYMDLDSARFIDAAGSKFDKWEKSVETHAPEALQAYKYVTDNLGDLDRSHKGYLNENDYESALLNPKLETSARKNLVFALDHKYFGSADDIERHFSGEVADRGMMPWNKGWYFKFADSPCLAFRKDLQSIKNADRDTRMTYLEYASRAK